MPASTPFERVISELRDRPRGRVLVGMSGGVDSATTVALLTEAGFDCVGATMRLYDHAVPGTKTCCSVSDILDARALCAALGVPHETLDYRAEFENEVVSRFVEAYEAGNTPNPCVECNRRMKFGLLARFAVELGCDYVATGHYARVRKVAGAWRLLRGAEPEKDQSYVLYPVQREQIGRLILPLGVLCKDEVRSLAEERGLPVAHKGESQDICFVPDGDYSGFLEDRHGGPYEPGPIVDTAGELLGTHGGLPRYTIGQRKGLGVASGRRLYVVDKDPASNTVVLGEADDLSRSSFVVGHLTWHEDVVDLREAEACVRYHGRARRVSLEPSGDEVLVRTLDEPFPSVAPGQSCVFYQGEQVLGGGIIR